MSTSKSFHDNSCIFLFSHYADLEDHHVASPEALAKVPGGGAHYPPKI